jgi:hypothetical protein
MKFYLTFNILMLLLYANCADVQKEVQCLICEEMFSKGFNFDEFMKDTQVIEKMKGRLPGADPLVVYSSLSKDNLEFIAKEVSMQYFFKGAESQFDEKTMSQVKGCTGQECEKLKLGLCENILSLEKGLCTTISEQKASPVCDIGLSAAAAAMDNKKLDSLVGQFEQQKGNTVGISQNDLINLINKNHGYLSNPLDRMTNMGNQGLGLQQLNTYAGMGGMGILNNPYMNNPLLGLSNEVYNKPNMTTDNISLLQVGQKYLEDPTNNTANMGNIGKQWAPPKPLLLDNFQNNIGEQLKDISLLTT